MKLKKLLVLLGMFLILTIIGCGYADNGEISQSETNGNNYTEVELQNAADYLSYMERVNLGCLNIGNIGVQETALIGVNSVKHIYNDFIMTLNADRHTYNTTDIIRIWGILEYIGENDSIKIWHSCPFMVFSIAGGGEIDFTYITAGIMIDVLATSVLERGRVYHFEYRKSGGFSPGDPNAEFWRNWFSEEDLLLPAGEYTIILIGAFSLSEPVLGSESGLRVELTIVVTE